MKILLGCEESQVVTNELRKLGYEAYSCDLKPCSGGHPEWHIQGDVIKEANSGKYGMGIFFPPCTHTAVSGAAHFEEKRRDGRQQAAINFFMALWNSPIKRIGMEQPVSIISSVFRKPDQIIQPYYFGDPETKTTCLWLKNLPLLKHVKENNLFEIKTHIKPEYIISKSGKKYSRIQYLGGGVKVRNAPKHFQESQRQWLSNGVVLSRCSK